MGFKDKRKTLVDVDLSIWGDVKRFATMKRMSVNSALEILLVRALKEKPSNDY